LTCSTFQSFFAYLSFRFLRNHDQVSATKLGSLSTQLPSLALYQPFVFQNERITRKPFWLNSIELLDHF